MMPSLLSTNSYVGVPRASHAGYAAANDAMLDELSRQLVAANSRRLSRGSGSQRMGNAARITKPGSANNSPRSSMLQSRRRTLIGESLQGRFHPQPVDINYLPTPASELPQEPIYERETRPTRPVSWHPTSHMVHPQPYPQQQAMPYAFSQFNDAEIYASLQHLPPTPAVYSGYNSPSSSFSPLSLPYSSHGSQQYYSPTNRSLPAQHTPAYQPTLGTAGTMSDIAYLPGPKVGEALDWNPFTVHGSYDRSTAPPTPEDFDQAPRAVTKVANDEDLIPYQPLEDDEESEGEILYGMGLYDMPDKSDGSLLDLHRSTVFSLLGSTGPYPEPTGKGLKLEDAWEPPASDDSDSDDDGDEDADGEDQEL
ncbi:hypothetical protein B0T25DRAFT_534368 [Lasiosphaeria hispida]|uniref:Uncharacterized protein n=1 Tax=Lasiosphaeria hispida TaxID=260671 RepID=A0AAJ0MI58_9PEZI|nr:hypothetical protein B0T25DRAFT_534368 [Lasiosphaeria hispida]